MSICKFKKLSSKLNFLLLICLFSFYGCTEEDIDYQQLFKSILIEEKGSVKSGTSLEEYTSQLLLADPYILCDDDGYYAYGTGTNCSYGLEVFYSKDLYTWENCGYVISKDIIDIEGVFWAPEVYKVGNKYLMYFANNNGSYNIYVAQSDSPRGPFTDISLVKSNAIDPTLYFDDNGEAFFYYCSYSTGGQSICFNKLSDDMKSVTGKETFCFTHSLSWENGITEGPSVFKIGDKLFIAYSAPGYTSQSYSVGLAVFDEYENTWVKYTESILSSNGIWFGTGHCSVFKDQNSEMRIVFHAHNSRFQVHPRRAYIGRLYSNDSGISVGNSFVIPHILNKE